MSEVERIEIRSAVWKAALAYTGAAAFALMGLALVVFSESLIEAIVGLIGFVFFGVFGAIGFYQRVRGQHHRVAVSRAGLEVYFPGVGWRRIPWGDIEEITVLDIAGQKFTGVRLRSYEALLAGLTPEQSRAAARLFASMRLFGRATAVLLGNSRLGRLLGGSEPVDDLSGMLAFSRERFGAELLFGWAQRDRNARDFAEFLRKWQRAGEADSKPR